MEVREGLDGEHRVKSASSVVCRLNKSFYGLKQAPRCWNSKFSVFLRQFSFKEASADKCICTGQHKR